MQLLPLLQYLLHQIQWRHREFFNIRRVVSSRNLEIWAVVTSISSSWRHPAAPLRPAALTAMAWLHVPLARGDAHGPGQQTGSTTCPPIWVHLSPWAAGTPTQSHLSFCLPSRPQPRSQAPALAPSIGIASAVGGMGAQRPLRGQHLRLALVTAAWPQP